MLKGGIKKMLDEFKMNRITPIFVFDGKPPKMKDSALNKRKQEKDIIDNMDEINNITKVKYNEKSIRPNRDTIIFVKNILDSKNVKYINAPNEADPVCAWLVKTGKAWACLSDDTDMFIYGCTRVLRSYSINNKSLMFYDFNKILEHLDLTFDQFREICVVSGTDYNNNDMNMNVNTVFQLYHEYKTNHVNLQTAGPTPAFPRFFELGAVSGGRTLSGFSKENPELSAVPFRASGLKVNNNICST
jgi:5'-3' exonuclease